MATRDCEQCGQPMRATGSIEKRSNGCLIALAFLAIGAVVFIAIPVVGWVAGPVIALAGGLVSVTRKREWVCDRCAEQAGRSAGGTRDSAEPHESGDSADPGDGDRSAG